MAWAVNLVGDDDTNGAITGAMLGAKYGAHQIPEKWISPMEGREELQSLTEVLSEEAEKAPEAAGSGSIIEMLQALGWDDDDIKEYMNDDDSGTDSPVWDGFEDSSADDDTKDHN